MIRPFPQVTAVIVSEADGQALLATSTLSRSILASRLPIGTISRHCGTGASRSSSGPPPPACRLDNPPFPSCAAKATTRSSSRESSWSSYRHATSKRSTVHCSTTVAIILPGLYREDGALLARYPSTQDMLAVAAKPNAVLMTAIARKPVSGMARGEAVDGVDRLIAYRRLDAYPVYATVGRSWHSIVVAWRNLMATHLIFRHSGNERVVRAELARRPARPA